MRSGRVSPVLQRGVPPSPFRSELAGGHSRREVDEKPDAARTQRRRRRGLGPRVASRPVPATVNDSTVEYGPKWCGLCQHSSSFMSSGSNMHNRFPSNSTPRVLAHFYSYRVRPFIAGLGDSIPGPFLRSDVAYRRAFSRLSARAVAATARARGTPQESRAQDSQVSD